MIESLKEHIKLGLDTSEVFILGKKNADFIAKLNAEEKLFDKMTTLEHPVLFSNISRKKKSSISISTSLHFMRFYSNKRSFCCAKYW